MSLTGAQMVKDARYTLENHWGYIWGKAGILWTEAKQKAVENDPDGREQTKLYGAKWIGHYVADCSGLIVWICKKYGLSVYHGSNSMYLKDCNEKGPIKSNTKLKHGALVFKYSNKYKNPYYHVGIYDAEKNKVIEAQGTYKGVIESSLFGWTHYGYLKRVNYGGDLKVGDKVIVDVPNDGTVNIREKASTKSNKLGTLPEGAEVEIAEDTGNGWCKVRYTGEGYIMTKFLRKA